MRYYNITIGGDFPATFTNQVNGVCDPGALQIELDIPIYQFAEPAGQAMVRIYGVSLQTISQAKDFNNAPITVRGGFQKGLPLANPAQSGVLLQGTIFQAFGNWIGTNQTLDLIVIPDGGFAATNGATATPNIQWSWAKGTDFNAAVTNALTAAYSGYTVNSTVKQSLALSEDDTAVFKSLEDFATHIQALTQTIVGGAYAGVQIVLNQKTFSIYDLSTPTNPTALSYNDFIGQPTWIEPQTVQFNCPMRADLSVGDYITFPTGSALLVTTNAASQSQFRTQSTFKGAYQIVYGRHVGNSRAPDAQSWISTFNAIPAEAAT